VDKFEANWMTFSLAALMIIGAFVLLAMGKISQDTMKWLMTTGIGAYTVRTVANKIVGGK